MKTANGFESIPGDPLEVQIFTLRNGMKVYMSVNPNEPRVYTNIAVRAGSKHDPPETTGLAHYMEHMLFKGTSRIGALDWEREAKYLEEISELFERHRQAEEQEERARIYREIDRLSFEAAKLVAPNEYDRLANAIGARDTNAYTWVEQTVYVNDIPSNELERWIQLESERFRMMALRLFHTELETVYEEFNIGQDQDMRKANNAIRKALFPNHPYGTQTTIGSAEHLKNPSQARIQEFFRTYYVPNNMAVILSGDFDPETAVRLAEQYFGTYRPSPAPPFEYAGQPSAEGPVRREVFGQQAAYVDIGWRFGGARTNDPLMLTIIRELFYNYQAGLLDLNLNQKQRLLSSHAWVWAYEDYSAFGLYGKPREGQSLEEVEALLMEEVDKLKQGDFEDWLLEAVIRNLRLTDIKGSESNRSRVDMMAQAFILGIDWARMAGRFDFWESLKKKDITDFANQHFTDNYVVVYKKQGDDPNVIKVEKPPITPVALRRDAVSEYGKSFLAHPPARLEPRFAPFEELISRKELQSGLWLDHVHNKDNEWFRLDYIFEIGKIHSRLLPVALAYLPYLGTSRYPAAALQQEFFRLGLSFDISSSPEFSYLTISGLDESLGEGLQLLEHLLSEVQEDGQALRNIIGDILSKRANVRKNRRYVLRNAMGNYARYGQDSPLNFRLSKEELLRLEPEQLVSQIRRLNSFEHRLHYYGPRPVKEVEAAIRRHHRAPERLSPVPAPRDFPQLPTEQNEVLFLDFPIVQADVMMISRGTPQFNLEEHLMREFYNEYFGYGMSSIVFQEIREAKALAYSTYAYYGSPNQKSKAHYLEAYVGTQPDKLQDAIPALSSIIESMPLVDSKAEQARQALLLRLESERITPSRAYWEARAAQRLGFGHDLREDLYRHLQNSTVQHLADFQQQYVKGRAFKYLVLGSRKYIDWEFLESIGPVRELTEEEVFG
ncbi:MAG: insulinase family protein [Lewinellaceae bacterium]|nr:insulinase family protein [Lewinellaceae bacterium]